LCEIKRAMRAIVQQKTPIVCSLSLSNENLPY
jgi:hypothetical protein